MLNSAPAGTGSVIRISPEFSSRLYAEDLAACVETSALGQFAPSSARNIGSLPWEAWNFCCKWEGVTLHPSATSWQLPQVRLFVPKTLKNGFVFLIGGWLIVLTVPLESAK